MAGGLGGLGGFNFGGILGALGQALLSSPRENPFQTLPQTMAAANEAAQQRQQQAAMATVAQKLGIDPSIAANPQAMALLINAQNEAKKQQFRTGLMERGGGLTPPTGTAATPVFRAVPLAATGALGTVTGGETAFRGAIAGIESGGRYDAVGPTHPKLGRALGKYQIMEANIGPWSKEALGREITPDEFISKPELQDKIFDTIFGGYVQKYGEEGAAAKWFSGSPNVNSNARDSLGTSVPKYVGMFRNNLARASGPVQPYQVAASGNKIPVPMQPANLPPPPATAAEGGNRTKEWAAREADYWSKAIIAAGDDDAARDYAKSRLEYFSKWITPTEAERNLENAGIPRGSPEWNAVMTNAPASWREHLLKRQDPSFSTQADFKEQELRQAEDRFNFERFDKDRDYRRKMEEMGLTPDIVNYRAYERQERGAGREPLSLFDYRRSLAQAGSNQPESTEQMARVKSMTDFLSKEAARLPAVAQRSADLDMLSRVVNKTATSRGAGLKATLDAFAYELGLSEGTFASQAELIDSITQRIAPTLREPGSGAQSDAELRGFLKGLPQVTATPGGNELIGKVLRRSADIDVQRADIAAKWQTGELSAADARRQIAQLDRQSIYASKEERDLIDRIMGGKPDQQTDAAKSTRVDTVETLKALPEGKYGRTADGNWYQKVNGKLKFIRKD